jgi:hypothetical protein
MSERYQRMEPITLGAVTWRQLSDDGQPTGAVEVTLTVDRAGLRQLQTTLAGGVLVRWSGTLGGGSALEIMQPVLLRIEETPQ